MFSKYKTGRPDSLAKRTFSRRLIRSKHRDVRRGVERLEDRRVLTTTFQLADLLPENGGDGTDGFSLNSGSASLSVGDVNGDTIEDMVAFAPYAESGKGGNKSHGTAYVVFGTASGFPALTDVDSLDGSNGFVIQGDPDDTSHRLFFSSRGGLSAAGDINGDGVNDIVLGWDQVQPDHTGKAYVVFGKDTSQGAFPAVMNVSSLDGQTGFVIHGVGADDHAGFSVASGGDINHDGLDDLVLGAPKADGGGSADSGETYIVYGRDYNAPGTVPFARDFSLGTLDGTDGFVIEGIDADDRSGLRVDVSGDINGDGITDLTVSARYADPDPTRPDAGQVYALFGRDGSVPGETFPAVVQLSDLLPSNGGDGSRGFVVNGIASDDDLYWASAGGDLNGDGVHDLAMGAVAANVGGNVNAGEAYVLFGGGSFAPVVELSGLRTGDGTSGIVIEGAAEGGAAGYSLTLGGDVNGDGLDDLLLAAPGADTVHGPESGEVYVIYGKAASSGFPTVTNVGFLSGSQGMVLQGERSLTGLGVNMSLPLKSSGSGVAVGDINDDGTNDILIGVTGDTRAVYGRDFTEPGMTVAPNAGLLTSESGGSSEFNVVLDTQPSATVTIDILSSDTSEGEIAGASGGVLTLTFDDTNWNVPQTVTIQGVDDPDQDGDQAYSIQLAPAVSTDGDYNGLDAADVSVINLDNDAPPASANDIYVWDIGFDFRTRGKKHDARIVIDVNRDDNADGVASQIDASAAGVEVTVELRDSSGGLVGTYTGLTDSSGMFQTDWIRDLADDTYTAEVVDLVHSTFDWNWLLDPNGDDEDADGDGFPEDSFMIP